jgi:hypothetical protein
MRKITFLLFIAIISVTSSCDDDAPKPEPAGDVEITFKANYDGETFVTQKAYDYADGMPVKFSTFNFFVANISLLEEQDATEETELIEIDFIDLGFDETQMTAAEAGVTISAMKVPAGTYRGLKVGFGVPADLNRTNPVDYGSSDALSKSSHYWSAWNSYIFAKIEGVADADGDGQFENSEGEGLTLHMGTDETYVERTLFPVDPIVVDEEGKIELTLNIDLKTLFFMPLSQYDENNDQLLDIQTFNGTHTDSELMIAKQIMNNFSEATKFD